MNRDRRIAIKNESGGLIFRLASRTVSYSAGEGGEAVFHLQVLPADGIVPRTAVVSQKENGEFRISISSNRQFRFKLGGQAIYNHITDEGVYNRLEATSSVHIATIVKNYYDCKKMLGFEL